MKPDPKLLDLIEDRYSPRAFTTEEISVEQLELMFEAARWAPSSRNEQPWRYIYAHKRDQENFQRLFSLLDEGNKKWAGEAAVLMLSVAKQKFDYKDKPNRHAFHDLGMASMNLVIQGMSMGIYTHFMAGYDVEKSIQELNIPEEYQPVAMMALGFEGDNNNLAEAQQVKTNESGQRERNSIATFAFNGQWLTK